VACAREDARRLGNAFANGIFDCSHSIDIKKTDKALRLRAALWLKVGDRDMDEKDAKEVTGGGMGSSTGKAHSPMGWGHRRR
jgi:hypothetical protein